MTETPTETPEPAKGEETGHAVYDLTEQRFVGDVHDTKADAEKAHTKRKGHKYETRKV